MLNAVLEQLNCDRRVLEGFMLVRELKLYLKVSHPHFHPSVRARIWQGTVPSHLPYSFELSHHAHTPTQAVPYYPSVVNFSSEQEAINAAIRALTSFIEDAIRAGYEPDDAWLVPNADFYPRWEGF